jgi:hypothetical protein
VILSTRTIELVADRIERAYLRRHPEGKTSAWDARIWAVAARALLESSRRDSRLPLDPELFVAAQGHAPGPADPWHDLAPAAALRRYRQRVGRLVRGLRRELRAELSRARRALKAGHCLDEVVARRPRWLSPLGRYILAYRAGRDDLLERLRDGARDQHDACPLYRLACRPILPPSIYPVFELIPGLVPTPRQGPLVHSVCLN